MEWQIAKQRKQVDDETGLPLRVGKVIRLEGEPFQTRQAAQVRCNELNQVNSNTVHYPIRADYHPVGRGGLKRKTYPGGGGL